MRIEQIRIECELSQSMHLQRWFKCELQVDWIPGQNTIYNYTSLIAT